MITLCSVVLEKIKHYEKIFLESIVQSTKLVSEVCLCQNDAPRGLYEEWTEKGIKFRRFGNGEEATGWTCGDQHGLGLNAAMNRATNEVVYCCDPDIFFMSAADEFFYNLKEKYELNAVGCSHHSATELAQTFFPWHGNVMMSKKDLPENDFLKEEGKLPGRFMMAGLGTSKKEIYPNPNGNFDTSSGLWLWAHQRNWKWLSFQSINVHEYTTKFCRGTFKFTERLPMQKLIHHAVSGSIEVEKWEPYEKAYKAFKESISDE